MVSYSSGQRGQTVNLLTMSSKVRILHSPPFMLSHINDAGVAQLARASAFQAEGRGFESRLPLHELGAVWIMCLTDKNFTLKAFHKNYYLTIRGTNGCFFYLFLFVDRWKTFKHSSRRVIYIYNAQMAQWQSTSLVRKRSAVQFRFWAPPFRYMDKSITVL